MLKPSHMQLIAAMGLLMVSLMPQAADKNGDKADNAEIKLHLDRVAQTLKQIPYAEEGEGPTIYVIAYSTCPHARRFENDWRGKLGNVKMRYVLYGIDNRTMNEAAALALSRDPADFHAFIGTPGPRLPFMHQTSVSMHSTESSIRSRSVSSPP